MHYFLDSVDRRDPWVEGLFRQSDQACPPTGPAVGVLSRAGQPAIRLNPAAPSLPLQAVHADPLSPLRQRDLEALAELFDHPHLAEIDQDVRHRLSQLVPEPPWEVEPYEFLREYL